LRSVKGLIHILLTCLLLAVSISAVYPVHPPWDITLVPDRVIISPPMCYAAFAVMVTSTYNDKPIHIHFDEELLGPLRGNVKFTELEMKGTPSNYEKAIRMDVFMTIETPPGEYQLRVYAYPAGSDPYEYQVYDTLTVVVVQTGKFPCQEPPEYPYATTIIYTATAYTTREQTVTTATKIHYWWDWRHWWFWRGWFEWWGWLRRPWITREPFDFTLEATPTTHSLKAGQQVTFTVYVTLVSGDPQPVTLSIPDICCGSTYSFSLTTGSPTFASALKVGIPESLKPGTYRLTIAGSGGGKIHSTIVTLEVAENKEESALTVSVNLSSLKVGESLSVGGALSPAHAATIELIYIRPDGFEMVKHIGIPISGVFSDIFKPDTPGLWSVKARWTGDDKHYGCESIPVSFAVEAVEEKPPPQPRLWERLSGLIILIVIIALIIAAAVLLLRRRSQRLRRPATETSRFCTKCGAEIPPGSGYCPNCGEKTA